MAWTASRQGSGTHITFLKKGFIDPNTILLIDTDLNLLKKNCIKLYLAH